MWVKGEIIHNLNKAHGGVADALTRNGQPHLFDRLTWFKLLWIHNDIGARPLIARSWAQGARCWLFLAEQKRGQATALANYYTLAFRPVFTGGEENGTRHALLVALARRLRHGSLRLHHISLAPVPVADGSADLIARAFRTAGWHVYERMATMNWTLNVNGRSFDDYWAERPGELRATLSRKSKKSDLGVEIHKQIIPELWAEYESIYAESWKPAEGSIEFLHAFAKNEARYGALRLGIARHEGAAVAAQLWTIEPGVGGPRAIIHKLAYRQSAAELSPGTILTAAMFRHVIDEDKVALIDYGTGDEAYKADWMEERNPLMQIDCYNPRRLAGLAGSARLRLRALARRGGRD
ncbi:MAG: GNAT family N-acetyltransferase [Alphaproteobacteria bacterium]|nr:GNAT family N-acetyltransferase [Alphaproteobacteria bacterium]MDE2340236.1 GNAT family N-acetyltransferase [Alphaproteobacteria bacterium]